MCQTTVDETGSLLRDHRADVPAGHGDERKNEQVQTLKELCRTHRQGNSAGRAGWLEQVRVAVKEKEGFPEEVTHE